jgi:hypothetical protein
MGRQEERKVHAVSPIVKGFAGALLGLSFQGAKNVGHTFVVFLLM